VPPSPRRSALPVADSSRRRDGLIYTDDDPHDPALFMSTDDARVYRALKNYGSNGTTAVELDAVLIGVKDIGNRLVQHGAARRAARGKYVAL
jgi:hypothetical protein